MQPGQLEALIRAYYAAFLALDRGVIERALAPDFRFTSPYDDAIDRAAFFQRCWPKQKIFEKMEVESVMVGNDVAFAKYQVVTVQGKTFRNTEFMRFCGEQMTSVDVYFGASYMLDGTFVPLASPKA